VSSRILLQLNILLCCLVSTVMISVTVPSAFATEENPVASDTPVAESISAAIAEDDPFKDRSAEFYYTDYSNLTWRHGKECVSQFHPSRDCFWLTQDPAGIKYDRISVPESKSQHYALAKESQSGLWVVVNLKGFKSLVRENDAENALKTWTPLGLAQPKLAHADDPFGPFQETGESYLSNQFRGLTLFWPYILLGLGLLYGFIEYVKYAIRSNRAARYRD
jgi:hypothetical protein